MITTTQDQRPTDVQRKAYVEQDRECDICGGALKSGTKFYDARILGSAWTWMCSGCFRTSGATLGVGRGQEYDSKSNVKTRG